MTETAIKSNQQEAARLFERGVAAARGGQRRVAAGLLARTVQLDPRHEMGWLWLSGVLDDPEEIAFCLRSVLATNPHNERARQGLAWLEQRGKIVSQPAPPAVVAPAPVLNAQQAEAQHRREAWWVQWRHTRRDVNRARLVLWLIPILLLLLTISLNIVLRQAIARNEAQALAAARPPAQATARPGQPAIIQAELSASRNAALLAYLSALEAPRTQLRQSIQAYRDNTGQPGGSSIAHAAAARTLRDQIDGAYRAIDRLTPPVPLAGAHANYLVGLEMERQALDDMLEFYSSLSIQYANRATLRMTDSTRQIEQARELFDAGRATVDIIAVPAQSAR